MVRKISMVTGAFCACCGDDSLVPRIACRVEPVSWHPRAFVYHHFLSDEEADHIIKLSRPFVSVAARGSGIACHVKALIASKLATACAQHWELPLALNLRSKL